MLLPLFPAIGPSPRSNHARSIDSVRVLRISVTDRCNLRCVYCMPPQGIPWMSRQRLLTFEQIVEVVRAAVAVHGLTRFKLTGGEPTVRAGLCDLVRMIRRIRGIEDLSLTTNGVLMHKLARPLKDAGLDRVTVSLDSLRPDRFSTITRGGNIRDVFAGLDAAESVGLLPLKINCVAMRGLNDDEFADFAAMSLTRDVTVRFIEYMPLGEAGAAATSAGPVGASAGCENQDRGAGLFISEAEIRRRIKSRLGPIMPVPRGTDAGVGPSTVYRLADSNAKGRVGFISAMSRPFCSSCNRLRLTADGVLRSCLFDGGETDLRHIFSAPTSALARRNSIAIAMTECALLRPLEHAARSPAEMSGLGG